MKILLPISIISLIIAIPSISNATTSITGTSNCDNATLNTYSGNVTAEANWTANTLTIKYDTGTSTTVANGSCTYDTTIGSLPSNIGTKKGYTFKQWALKAGFDLSTLDTSINGTEAGYIYLNGTLNSNTTIYNLTENGDWAVEFSYGTVKGIALCATNSVTQWTVGTPEGTTGANCWCKVTGFDAEKDGTYQSIVDTNWVFLTNYESASSCASYCTDGCARNFQWAAGIRSAMYSSN